MSAEGTKNVSWPWLSPIQGWGSLTMAFTGKFVYTYTYIYIYIYILLFREFIYRSMHVEDLDISQFLVIL